MKQSLLSASLILALVFGLTYSGSAYEISWGSCEIKAISDDDAKKLQGEKDYQDLTIKFTEDATSEDFATITKLPWVKKVAIGGSKIHDITPVKSLPNLVSFDAQSVEGIEEENPLDISPLKDVTTLEELNCYGTPVKGEKTLGTLTKMKDLNFYMSYVADISCVANMPDLESLDLYACKAVTNLKPMKGLSKLKHVNLYMNESAPEEFMVLNTLPALESIWLHFSKITDLSCLANAKSMKDLDASWCRELADISAVSGMTSLTTLEIDDAPVSDFSPLKGLSSIETLVISGTKLNDLSDIGSLPNLTSLDISETAVTDLSPLSGLKKLETLTLSDTKVADLAPLGGITSLTSLDLSGTPVTDLTSLKGLTKLANINLSKTKVTDITPIMNMPLDWMLYLPKTVPQAQVDQLKKKFPDLNVEIDE